MEGEGALVISVVKNSKVTNGVVLQPEFNVAQHENGINILHSFKSLFGGLGSVQKKSGSAQVWTYSIKGTQNLKNYVLPFFENYVIKYSCKYTGGDFQIFSDVLKKLDENKKKTMDKSDLISLVRMAYKLNSGGKGKERKRSIDEVIEIINSKNVSNLSDVDLL